MPKFEFEYDIEMKSALTALGMIDAYSFVKSTHVQNICEIACFGRVKHDQWHYRLIIRPNMV